MAVPTTHDAFAPIGRHEVELVLQGKTTEGRELPQVPCYPRAVPSVDALLSSAHALSELALAENTSCLALHEQRTALIRRLASFMIATGQPSSPMAQEVIAQFASHIATRPLWYQENITGGMRRRAAKPDIVLEVVPLLPEPVIYAEGRYVLYELTHPRHLQAEGQRTKNCLGTSYDTEAARKANASPGDIRYLRYWRRIAKGKRRLFSLRTRANQVLATFELTIKNAEVTEIQYANATLYRPIMGFIAKALFVSGIRLDNFSPPFDLKGMEVLLRCGEWVSYAPSLHDHIIGGNIEVPADIDVDTLRSLVVSPGLHLNFDESNNHQMPLISGPLRCRSVYSFTTVWPEAVTAIPTHIYFEKIQEASFTCLQSIDGTLSLHELTDGQFPALRCIKGMLDAFDLATYSFPQLRSITGGLSLADYRAKGLPMIDVEDLRLHQQLRDFELNWDPA